MAGRTRTLAPRARTYLPNAHALGYGKRQASPGDVVRFSEEDPGRCGYGVVLGRITSCDGQGIDATGYLAVATIGSDMSFGFERWVAPSHVVECLPRERVCAFMTAILNADIAMIERALAANDGTLAVTKDGALWTGDDRR